MERELAGKVAIVTGGASGIGRETARVFAREGASVLIADRDAALAEVAAAELREAGHDARELEVDVVRFGDCERMAATARDTWGRVDALVACAGVFTAKFFVDTEPAEWRAMLDVNVYGVMNASRAVAPLLVEQRGGAIVNVASDAGKIGEKRMAVYSATKGAVIAFTKALALELGRARVRVNAVCPGTTRTPMTADFTPEQIESATRLYPLGRLGEPGDIAETIAFLVSDRSAWLTGQAISVDGGYQRS